ncbi:MAG: glycosyl hydrolase family 28-related protein [Verrucomicrobiales bacterium]|nr:glycosyl hydrolase family 28-related protein [Verrucomicrobiales bacterium]
MNRKWKQFFLAILLPGILPVVAWESPLYDAGWSPVPALDFYTDKLIQDFSYAGYHRGEQSIPDVAGPVFHVVNDYGADPTGVNDSTAAIQAAIDAAELAGGGVVYLPAGTFAVAPGTGQNFALRINGSPVVMRGAGKDQTFLLCTSYEMRSKRVIEITGSTPHWGYNSGTAYTITEDLPGPVLEIPVADVAPFAVGDWIVIRTDVTPEWVTEHKEPLWLGYESSLGGLRYSRQILEIDAARNRLIIDAPTRYAIKTRDNARVYIRNNALAEVGLEDFSIGGVQHPGNNWGESDYTDPAKSAYDTHASYLISWRNARNSWMRRVDTFQASGNTSGAHLLSNGLLLTECRGVTVEDCHFQRPQYGGGGGNGYMFRLSNSNECLVQRCTAEFSRHGIVFSHMGSSGNVIHDCLDRDTGKATGSTGSYNTSGKASDHHMRFSHSNLVDVCRVKNSWFTAHYRPYGTAPKHNLTSAHTVFWNLLGESSPIGKVVHSQQSRYGYVVGTRGAVTAVETGGTSTEKTDPVDHVEGVGAGDSLDPFSLYLDQFGRRLGLPKVDLGDEMSFYFPVNRIPLPGLVRWGDAEVVPGNGTITWSQTGGPPGAVFDSTSTLSPRVALPGPGEYEFTCVARLNGMDHPLAESSDTVTVRVFGPALFSGEMTPVADGFVFGDPGSQNQGFNTGTSLWMKNVNGTDYDREFFLQFDLAEWSGVLVEVASLEIHAGIPDTDCVAETFFTSDDSWNESSLTWASRPAFGESLSVWSPAPTLTQNFDLTSRTGVENAEDGILSLGFRIQSQQTSATVFRYASREAADANLRPTLRAVLRRTDLPSFEDWINGIAGVAVEDRDPSDDPDEDDLPNLAEQFHELLPDQISASPFEPGSDEEGGFLRFVLDSEIPENAWLKAETTADESTGPWSLDPSVSFEPGSLPGEVRLRLPEWIRTGHTAGVRLVYSVGNTSVELPLPLRSVPVTLTIRRISPGTNELTWTDAGGGSYRVFRGTTMNFGEAELTEITSGFLYEDDEANPAVDTYYWVQAVNAAGISGQTVEPTLLAAMPARPDLSVGSSLSTLAGGDVYGLTRLGMKKVQMGNRKSIRFFFTSESDELPEEILIRGTKGHRSARFSYSRLSGSKENITAAVWSGNFQTEGLTGGGRENYEMRLKLLNPKKRRVTGTVVGRSSSASEVTDRVRVGVKVLRKR